MPQILFTGTFYATVAILPIILRDNHQNNLSGMKCQITELII